MCKNGDTTAYRESLRLKIQDKAMQLFKSLGVKAVKMDDIATDMGISKRTLYEIYSNKEDLLFECVKHNSETLHVQLVEYAKNAENEMDMLAYFMKMRLNDLGSINPRFFSELHKYSRIVEFLQRQNENQRANSSKFIMTGIKNGFFREDLNYDIVHKLGDAAIHYVMETKMYQKYSLKEIFHTFIIIYMQGCCTEKGLRYLEELTSNDKYGT